MAEIANFPKHLLDVHHAWHEAGSHPGLPSRAIPPGQPGSGLEFLQFHRDFVAQFHAWYDTQPGADQAAVTPWTQLPPEVKSPNVGWNANLAAQEQRITANNPPFSSADELGQFIENGIHNWIHGAVATAFNEPFIGTLHSPRSTYFYKIHGLVDLWWQHWHAPKLRIKDIIDSNPKRIIDDKLVPEHKPIVKDLVPDKPVVKDVIPDNKQFKELKEKDKDKDVVENPGFPADQVFDPVQIQLQQLSQRMESIEGLLTRPAFIRPSERPEVGPQAAGEQDVEPSAGGEQG